MVSGESTGGIFQVGEGNEQIFGWWGGDSSPSLHGMGNPDMCTDSTVLRFNKTGFTIGLLL